MTPEVSIVIPTFNRAGTLKNTLESVSSQTARDWECLVVDDGSTDDTDALVLAYTSKDPRFKYFKRPADRIKGANACRNIGISNSAGKYITFLDSDDVYLPEHIGKRFTQLVNSNADGSYGTGFVFDGIERRVLNTTAKPKEISWFDFVLQKTIQISSLFIRREIAAETLFDENLLRHQDWDFLFSAPASMKFEFFDQPTFVINWIRNEKRSIHFPSCIEVYKRHKSQLTTNEYLKQYLLGMYEKAVNYRAHDDIIGFYRDEVKKHFSGFTSMEKIKLEFPLVYRAFRSTINRVR